MARDKDTFKSSIGVILTIIGSAVGFGNFWRFPYLVGQNGGGAFIFVYLLTAIFLGIPLIVSEYIIGRSTHKDFINAFKVLRPGSKWYLIGYLTLLTVILISGFYCVIGGWTIHALIATLPVFENSEFSSFLNTGWQPVILALLFISIACYVVSKGIQKGSEKYNKVLMPTLFVVLLIMCVYSFTLPGFKQSINFLFRPDFSKITFETMINAFGQVFFSLSVGMGIYATYASYVDKDEKILQGQTIITLSDIGVAILAGIIIFSAVFSYGISPTEGPTLVFIALPSLFSQMPLGTFTGILFYVTLGIAALTSAISLIEVITTCFVDHFNISRKRSCLYIFLLESTIAIIAALSQVDGSILTINGKSIFDILDYTTSNWMLTIACILTSLFIGWKMDRKLLTDLLTCGGQHSKWFIKPYLFILKFIVPLALVVLILSNTGIVK